MMVEIKEGIQVYLDDKRLPLMISGHFRADAWYAGTASFACGLGMTAMALLLAVD